jgi:hypothetical protein
MTNTSTHPDKCIGNVIDLSPDSTQKRIEELRTIAVWEHHVAALEEFATTLSSQRDEFYVDGVEYVLKLQKANRKIAKLRELLEEALEDHEFLGGCSCKGCEWKAEQLAYCTCGAETWEHFSHFHSPTCRARRQTENDTFKTV